jgi:methylated-DNA-protein-cysteine methyltransferase-like protein
MQRVVGPGLRERVIEVVCRVPLGQVTTYGDVAALLGHRRAARRVGQALAGLPSHLIDTVPWWRVINAEGRIVLKGDFARGEDQRRRLEVEGVRFGPDHRCDLAALRWRPVPE